MAEKIAEMTTEYGADISLEEIAKKHGARGVTAKQARFCDEYLIDFNQTQAAIRAGYSKKTAGVIGNENLKKPYIKEYIKKRMAEKEAELIADQNEVLKYLTAVMRREKTESIVITIKEERQEYAPDEHGTMRKQTIKSETPEVVEIPAMLRDANKAAELLGKTYGIYADKEKLAIDKSRLAIEEKRLELEESKQNAGVTDDSQYGVVVLAPILEDEDDE